MIRVRYTIITPNDDRPTLLDGNANAVLASNCAEFDIGAGGVTREEVRDQDIAALITYPIGSELFAESNLDTDCLDDSTDETAARTRIWWRAVVTGREP